MSNEHLFEEIINEALSSADNLTEKRGRMASAEISLNAVRTSDFVDYLKESKCWQKCRNGYINTKKDLVIKFPIAPGNNFRLGRNY